MRYTLARGLSEPVERQNVILVGNGRRLVYRRGNGTPPNVVNQKEIRFTEVRLWLKEAALVKMSSYKIYLINYEKRKSNLLQVLTQTVSRYICFSMF